MSMNSSLCSTLAYPDSANTKKQNQDKRFINFMLRGWCMLSLIVNLGAKQIEAVLNQSISCSLHLLIKELIGCFAICLPLLKEAAGDFCYLECGIRSHPAKRACASGCVAD